MQEAAEYPLSYNSHNQGGVVCRPQHNEESMRNSVYAASINESVRLLEEDPTAEQLATFFEDYQPISSFKMADLNATNTVQLKKYRESVYYGQVMNGRRDGKGIMVYNNGRVYEGEWHTDSKHGKGFQKYSSGATYDGSFVNGRPEGVGTYLWPNGQIYEGQWVNGLKHGSGMWRGARGDSYIGEWKFGKADGDGVHTWINGDRYQGEFKTCLKHGQGTEKFANGDSYTGTYANGKPSGYGQYSWTNSSFFKGYFKNGLRHGHGVWKKGVGQSDKYQGQYANDRKSGYGIFTWATGNIYKGNYFDDVRHGYGQMYWSDGSCYKGQWEKGIQHGQGEISIPGQPVKRGLFENNVMVKEQAHNLKKKSKTEVVSHSLPPDKTQVSFEPRGFVKPRELDRMSYNSRARINSKQSPSNVNESRITEFTSLSGNSKMMAHRAIIRPQQISPIYQNMTRKANSRTVTTSGAKSNQRAEKIPHSSYYLYNITRNYNPQKAANSIRKRIIMNSTAVDRGFQYKKRGSVSIMTSKASSNSNYRARRVQTGLNKTEIAQEVMNFTKARIGTQTNKNLYPTY